MKTRIGAESEIRYRDGRFRKEEDQDLFDGCEDVVIVDDRFVEK